MAVRQSPVSQCLDRRLTIAGFEVLDLLAIFLVLSVLNLLFSGTTAKVFLVWLPTAALAVTLRLGKRGKPDNFLVHWLRFQIEPGLLSAFADPVSISTPFRQGGSGHDESGTG
jgi:hypothetical protein